MDDRGIRLKSHAKMVARVHNSLVRGAYAYWITLDRAHIDKETKLNIGMEFTRLLKITNANLIGVNNVHTTEGASRWAECLSNEKSVFKLVNSVLEVGIHL